MDDHVAVRFRQLRPLLQLGAVVGFIAFALAYRAARADDRASSPPSDVVSEHDRQFWSFRKVARPAVPNVSAASRVRSPVDAFVLAALEARGLSLSPDADRPTLLRRVWLDLVGVPPSPAQATAFLDDESPQAYERLVDRLLASPQFGERWGRHWLDVAGYVDTVGFDVDVDNVIMSEGKWRYRDYVILAFNDDKPYDRFLHEQLAGDELVDWRRAPKFTSEIRDVLVATGFLRVLCDAGASPMMDSIAAPYADTNGRRLALARWLTARDSRPAGLVARVMVNRVWQHLFQTGIVPTPENFGPAGAAPTHPQLLEWLSAEFIDSGWKIKPLIRRIVCSTVYRQSAGAVAELARVQNHADRLNSGESSDRQKRSVDPSQVDPDNVLLWRMRLKRLDSEAIRDCILAASGTLDPTMGGPPIMLEGKPDGMIVVAEKQLPTPTAKWRRSIYLLARRAFQLSELAVFDQPVVATNCPERSRSAVPLQSLAMLNGALSWEQAEKLAARIEETAASANEESIRLAFQRALVRQPSAAELQESVHFLEKQSALHGSQGQTASEGVRKALVHLCHTLLNTSEFLYTP